MQRVAVLVDAGYLFAQGSAALAGSSQPRHQVRINAEKAIAAFRDQCESHANGCSLLRIYWYDGVSPRGPTADHENIASCDNIKLRLGFINSQGQQKGVDSLIVTDLIELARNRAISDAILMAGDEDLRIGVQVAQSYGVRVHLLGIAPARASQSKQLRQEADTTYEWDRATISAFIVVQPGLSTRVELDSQSPVKITPTNIVLPIRQIGTPAPSIQQCSSEFAEALNTYDLNMVNDHWNDYHQIPNAVDRKLLASTRDRIGRMLDSSERSLMRSAFVEAITSGSLSGQSPTTQTGPAPDPTAPFRSPAES